jgi:hypothetical protein
MEGIWATRYLLELRRFIVKVARGILCGRGAVTGQLADESVLRGFDWAERGSFNGGWRYLYPQAFTSPS